MVPKASDLLGRNFLPACNEAKFGEMVGESGIDALL